MTRRATTGLVLSGLLVLVVWHLAWLLAGDDRTGDPRVPGLPDLVGELRALGNYWTGGLGVDAPRDGGQLTWLTAVLGIGAATLASGLRLAAGLALGIGLGIGLAVVVCWSRWLRGLFALPAHFARMLPLLAMVPLFAFWFGNTELGTVLFVALTAFVTVFAITISAIGNVPVHHERTAQALGAGRVRTYLTVVLPAASVELRGGILLAVGFGWSAVITSEYLTQETGLGKIVQNAEFFGRTQMLGLVGFITVVLAAATYLVVARVLDHVTRWSE
jgi:sulfonate transport system permease protein